MTHSIYSHWPETSINSMSPFTSKIIHSFTALLISFWTLEDNRFSSPHRSVALVHSPSHLLFTFFFGFTCTTRCSMLDTHCTNSVCASCEKIGGGESFLCSHVFLLTISQLIQHSLGDWTKPIEEIRKALRKRDGSPALSLLGPLAPGQAELLSSPQKLLMMNIESLTRAREHSTIANYHVALLNLELMGFSVGFLCHVCTPTSDCLLRNSLVHFSKENGVFPENAEDLAFALMAYVTSMHLHHPHTSHCWLQTCKGAECPAS